MEKDCLVVRKTPRGPILCYSKDEELLMGYRQACVIKEILSSSFPGEEYIVFKEVKNNAKKGVSVIKES